jgi:hypothetical protein
MDDRKIIRALMVISGIFLLLRICAAAFVELSNDEAYYWTYALFPDWSHFDHPPMVGWMIQLFTLNLRCHSEFFLRLPALVLGTVNIWQVFMIGRKLRDSLTGFYAALLYIASVYCSVIAGVFILPDTPQVFFWLLSLYAITGSLLKPEIDRSARLFMLLFGLFTGLALLSKYTSAFLWVGVLLFILAYRRDWLKTKELYLALLISLLCFIPVIVWNFQHQFISFTYQGERVSASRHGLRPDFFLTELLGELLYNNPVNFVLYFIALIGLFRLQSRPLLRQIRIFLAIGLPLVLVFWLFSLFRSTLPHWTGPAFVTLLFPTAVYFREKLKGRMIPRSYMFGLVFLSCVLIIGMLQVRNGLLLNRGLNIRSKIEDVSLDLYGWHQLAGQFTSIAETDRATGKMSPDAVMLSWRWFPAANLDYYVAHPLGIRLYALGEMERIHKYRWINKARGPVMPGSDAYFICSGRDMYNPAELMGLQCNSILPPDSIPVYRNGVRVMQFYLYRIKGIRSF